MYIARTERYDSMPYRRCGRSGLRLPLLSLGLWHNFGGIDTLSNSRELMLRSFDLGITHFDLANNYGPPPGSAEETFGQVMASDLGPHRDEMIISTKAGYLMWPGPYGEWGSRKYLLASLDQSLRRMRLDYVDVFYSHRFDPETPLEETMSALAQARAFRQGTLRRNFELRSPADHGSCPAAARDGNSVPDPPGAVLHVPAAPRAGAARRSRQRGRGLHCVQPAGAGPSHGPLSRRRAERFRARHGPSGSSSAAISPKTRSAACAT